MFGKSVGCYNDKLYVGAPGGRFNQNKNIQSTGGVYIFDLKDNNKQVSMIKCDIEMA